MTRTAIILAGGLGTRLRSVVPDLPKPMADIGGRPFLSFLLDQLVNAGITDIVLAVGYRHDVIADHFGARYRDAGLRYSIESRPLGTGGAVNLALQQVPADPFLLVNGDSYFALDLPGLLRSHQEHAPDLTLALKAMPDTSRYGRVALDDSLRVIGFHEKAGGQAGTINAGYYVISRHALPAADPETRYSLETYLAEHVKRLVIRGYPSEAPFIDIGIPKDYARLRQAPGMLESDR